MMHTWHYWPVLEPLFSVTIAHYSVQAALANEKTPELSREFIKEYLNQLLG